MSAAKPQRSKRVRRPSLSPDFVYELPMASKKKTKHLVTGDATKSPIDHPVEEEQMLGFHELPEEIILQVLRYLPIQSLVAASCVCKKWRKLCKDSSLWKCVSLEGTEINRLPWNFWKRLEKLGTTCLDLHGCWETPRKAIKFIIKRTQVKAVYLGVVEKADLLTIVENMPQLQILDVMLLLAPPLVRNFQDFFGWDGSILFDVGKLSILKDLQELRLNSAYPLCLPTICFHGGMKALEELTKLKKLVLCNFENIGDEDLCFLSSFRHLEHLELGNCSEGFSASSLVEMENLQVLRLTQAHCHCSVVPCTCIGSYLRQLKKLRKLSLIMCQIPADLAECLQELPELKNIEIWPFLDTMVHPPFVEDMEEPIFKDKEEFVDIYASIFRGLEHLPSITVGVLEKSIGDPFKLNLQEVLAEKFYPGKDLTGWLRNLEDGDESNEEATLTRRGKRKRRGRKKGKGKQRQMGMYDRIKHKIIDLLPSTRLTFYRVKMENDFGNDMFYVARREEHFNMPTLSQA